MRAQLNKKELLYLSSFTGMDNIWGFDDPFSGAEEAELRAACMELQNSLIDKSCLMAKADGSIDIAERWRKILTHCRDSERIYILNSSQFEEKKTQLRLFVNNGKVIRYSCTDSANISCSSMELIKAEIIDFFGEFEGEETTCSFATDVARMRRMGSLSRERFLRELKSDGCEESFASVIVDGMQGNPDFCSLLAFDRIGSEYKLAGKLVTLRFAGSGLMVTSKKNSPDSICFTKLNHERFFSELNLLIGNGKRAEAI